jgi:hypothetical protein
LESVESASNATGTIAHRNDHVIFVDGVLVTVANEIYTDHSEFLADFAELVQRDIAEAPFGDGLANVSFDGQGFDSVGGLCEECARYGHHRSTDSQ